MTTFTTTSYPVATIVSDIEHGKIGLPDLQRPFVWSNVKVRDLFDSLYKGYPVGFLLFWDTGADGDLKRIGTKSSDDVPQRAIVDGQQRLTSLYAVLKGEEVIRSNFEKERIRIAFNPITERFAVPDAAVVRDKSFIPDISEIWNPDANIFSFASDFLSQLSSVREISEDDKTKIQNAIGKLHGIPTQYFFTTLTLSASVDGAAVADVFVRINGKGARLNQSNFIMTLMSVYWDEGRTELEDFARKAKKLTDHKSSPFNHFIKPSPDQMLRATVGLSLKRARLESVYNALRGRDAKTGVDNPDKRDEQFRKMMQGQMEVLDLNNWHHFLGALTLAGYRGERMISSGNAVIYSYVLYLIGLVDYEIDKNTMRQVIAEFFFMAALTARYTSSPETRFESDLSLFCDPSEGKAYVQTLRNTCATILTQDFWNISLPSQLATSGSNGPSLFAYNASLIKLDAEALYGSSKIANLFDPSSSVAKHSFGRSHLFSSDYLKGSGVRDTKKVNQIANYTYAEWPENIRIGKTPPSEYIPEIDAALSAERREQLYFWHALPQLWWETPYDDFLIKRRERMALVIKSAWEALTGDEITDNLPEVSVRELIASGENDTVEFKSTLRVNLHTGAKDEKIEFAALKTIAGFLNSKGGGTLLIGISDDGEALGLEADGFPNEDKMSLHLTNLIKSKIGDVFTPYIHPSFEGFGKMRVLSIRCDPGPRAAFLKDGQQQRFFVRGGASTVELKGNSLTDYERQRY